MAEEKKMINGGDVLIKCLLQEKVKYLFVIPGGQFLNMYDAIYRWGKEKGIETVLFRHEVAAAHAADAWARLTNTPGICFGTVGPGAMNLISGVGTAWADNIPLIVIICLGCEGSFSSFFLSSRMKLSTVRVVGITLCPHTSSSKSKRCTTSPLC